MQKLQCELCGSIDILRTDDGFFQCQHCGCKYTLEQAKNLLGIVAETTIGDTELNRRVENAKAQIKIGQPAEETIESIIKDFPASPKGYMLEIENIINNLFKEKSICFVSSKNNKIRDYCTSLLKLAENSKEISIEEANVFLAEQFQRLYDGILNGDVYFSDVGAASYYSACHSLMQKAYDIGITNAKKLMEANVEIINETHYYAGDNRYYNTDFALGKVAIISAYGDEHLAYSNEAITDKNINSVIANAKANTLNQIKNNKKCVLCGSKVKKTLIGNNYKCTNISCGTTFNINDMM